MAKGRELVGRIKSTENTRKITRTMEMVSASKMKRAMDRVIAARPYATALGDVISSLYNPELAESFPLLRQPQQVKRAAVILLTSIGQGLHRFVIAEFSQFGTNLISITPGKVQTHGASVGAVDASADGSVEGTDCCDRPYYRRNVPRCLKAMCQRMPSWR